TRDLRCGHDLIQQWDSGHLVRHGDECTMDIGKLEHELEKSRVVLGLAAHRNDNGINVVFLEIGVVDHGCLEALGRIAEMGNELRASADRHWHVPLLNQYSCEETEAALTPPLIRTHL